LVKKVTVRVSMSLKFDFEALWAEDLVAITQTLVDA
jgi:hypothetical protein